MFHTQKDVKKYVNCGFANIEIIVAKLSSIKLGRDTDVTHLPAEKAPALKGAWFSKKNGN